MSLEIIIKIVNVLIFSFLSGIHIYWAFGGMGLKAGTLPTKDGELKLHPRPLGTLVVASGLGIFAYFSGVAVVGYHWVYLVMGGLFALRMIGDFRYVGLFKKVKDSVFAKNDTGIFIPLCIYLALSNAFLYFC